MFSDSPSGASLSLNFSSESFVILKEVVIDNPPHGGTFESIVPHPDGGHSHESQCREPWRTRDGTFFENIHRCFAHAEPVHRVHERIAMHIVSTLFDMSVDAVLVLS